MTSVVETPLPPTELEKRHRPRNRSREPQISDSDVLQPVTGILDVLDSAAFVRTSGYLASPDDVYVSIDRKSVV